MVGAGAGFGVAAIWMLSISLKPNYFKIDVSIVCLNQEMSQRVRLFRNVKARVMIKIKGLHNTLRLMLIISNLLLSALQRILSYQYLYLH